MASEHDWRAIAAQAIYRAYPDSDLLPIDPPAAGETIGDFVVRAEGAGDTLFLFLCRLPMPSERQWERPEPERSEITGSRASRLKASADSFL